MKERISPRERVRLALSHREADRIPIGLVCSGINPAARRELETHLRETRGIGVDEYLEPLVDVRTVEPRYTGPALPPNTDIWGVRRRPVSYGAGAYDEIEHYPLAQARGAADLDAFDWPRLDLFDYDGVRDRIRTVDAEREHCIMAWNGNIFETAWYMRGFQDILVDLVEQPDFVRALLDRVTAFYVGHFRALLTAARGRYDLVFTADDIAGQNGLLMSLPMWEEHLKPHHVALNRAIHELGARVIYHTDGAVMEAVPGLIDMGIDVLQALQFDAAGMDPAALKDGYGDRLCFEGGVSVQKTLPFGTPEEVAAEVRDRVRVLGRGGGYILGPSHYIQDGTPAGNIAALFDAAALPLGS
jgi:uroporphyrinogen decarboxylase